MTWVVVLVVVAREIFSDNPHTFGFDLLRAGLKLDLGFVKEKYLSLEKRLSFPHIPQKFHLQVFLPRDETSHNICKV